MSTLTYFTAPLHVHINLHRKMSKLAIADLKQVYKATFEARNEWKNILLELEISSATIRNIGMRCRDDPKDCYREGLSEWLESGDRSWGDLVDALSSPTVGHGDIAMVIERDYIQSASAISSIISGKQTRSGELSC